MPILHGHVTKTKYTYRTSIQLSLPVLAKLQDRYYAGEQKDYIEKSLFLLSTYFVSFI